MTPLFQERYDEIVEILATGDVLSPLTPDALKFNLFECLAKIYYKHE